MHFSSRMAFYSGPQPEIFSRIYSYAIVEFLSKGAKQTYYLVQPSC